MIKVETFNLDPRLFTTETESVSAREGYGEGLVAAGEMNERVVALCADLTGSTKTDLFASKFPERFIQVGVAEQNMVAVASGLASMKMIPFAATYAVFSPGRSWEQIRTTVCYNNVPVKLVSTHAGISVGPDGGTHQALEDIALTRTLPRMVVLSPCDALEARKATLAAAESETPVYIRLARVKTPVVTTEGTSFEIGPATLFYGTPEQPAEVLLAATGSMVYKTLQAARQLEAREGLKVKVLNVSTIKPLDNETILKLAAETKAVVTVEEHQQAGGLGGAVAEVLAASRPTPQEWVAVADQFGQSGKPEELLEHYGLSVEAIVKAALRARERKNA